MPQRTITEKCFVSTDKRIVIDIMASDGRSWIMSQTLEEMRLRYPDVKVLPSCDAVAAIEDSFITAAREIGREVFIEALEVLPPQRWKRDGDTESFFMSEFLYGTVTSHYVRIGKRHFAFSDHASLSHQDVVRKAMINSAITH